VPVVEPDGGEAEIAFLADRFQRAFRGVARAVGFPGLLRFH
jgi:hypothetical protein